MSKDKGERTNWRQGRRGSSNTLPMSPVTPNVCIFPLSIHSFPCSSLRLATGCLYLDEDLGQLFKAQPPTEDVYVYNNNGPA